MTATPRPWRSELDADGQPATHHQETGWYRLTIADYLLARQAVNSYDAMRAALKWIVDHGDTGKGGRPAHFDMRAKARAALALAEGKGPYANRTQARRKCQQLGPGWAVFRFSSHGPFYVDRFPARKGTA